MRFALLILFVLLALPAQAVWLTGTVSDQSGTPIEGAIVMIEGTNLRVLTNAEGKYQIKESLGNRVQIRVSSPEHVHLNQWLELAGDNQIKNFVLMATLTDNILVTANGLENSVLESVLPVTVISGDQLRRDQEPTVGETLNKSIGVHSSYFGPVASSPIIRGADGPRVKVVQNGLDTSDVSRVGQDHAVAADASTATHIEVLRGPATLQFGDGAIGGVVNVVDNRIPRNLASKKLHGDLEMRTDSASNERFGKVNLSGGSGAWAYHIDGFSRKTDNFEIPGFAEIDPDEGEEPGELPNSSIDTQSFTAGMSWSGRNGLFGVSAQKFENLYGLPGHGHGGHHEEEGHDEEEGEEEGHGEEEEEIFLNADMERFQLRGEWYAPFAGIQKLSLNSGFTDYNHFEEEDGAPGTTFSSETFENRLSLRHNPIGGWEGILGIHQSQNDYSAIGEEAFTPPTQTDSFAVYLAEERTFGEVRVEVGARYNYSDITPNGSASFELGHHEEDGHEDDHNDKRNEDDEHHGDEHEGESFDLTRQTFNSFSVSSGFNWNYSDGRSLALVLTRAERAPSTPELFSAGAHLATSTYEIGAVFGLDDDGEVVFRPDQVSTETSTGLDLVWRKFDGRFGYSVSAFYNRVNDYFYQQNTGLVFAEEEGEHEDDHGSPFKNEDDHGDEHGDEEGLPVLLFRQDDARIYGLELELTTKFNQNWSARFFGDSVRTQLDEPDNGSRNLPRLPPLRLGAVLNFNTFAWAADLGATWYDDQTRVAAFETTTEGYTLLHAGLSYRHDFQRFGLVGFLRGKNLGDEEARVHTSFIKNQAPLPGRSFLVGLRLEF